MDLRDTPEEATFRAEVRAWLDENLPAELHGHRGSAARFDGPEMRAWSRALYEGAFTLPEALTAATSPSSSPEIA